jgi:hypothetical protein
MKALRESDELLALHVLGWILTDEPRRERLLGLTGLSPEDLRASLEEPATLGAILQFIAAHEADLMSCADAIGVTPEELGASARRLSAEEGIME